MALLPATLSQPQTKLFSVFICVRVRVFLNVNKTRCSNLLMLGKDDFSMVKDATSRCLCQAAK